MFNQTSVWQTYPLNDKSQTNNNNDNFFKNNN